LLKNNKLIRNHLLKLKKKERNFERGDARDLGHLTIVKTRSKEHQVVHQMIDKLSNTHDTTNWIRSSSRKTSAQLLRKGEIREILIQAQTQSLQVLDESKNSSE
jgi:hypothetical protein